MTEHGGCSGLTARCQLARATPRSVCHPGHSQLLGTCSLSATLSPALVSGHTPGSAAPGLPLEGALLGPGGQRRDTLRATRLLRPGKQPQNQEAERGMWNNQGSGDRQGWGYLQPSLVGVRLCSEDLPHLLGFCEDSAGTLALALCWAGERAQ